MLTIKYYLKADIDRREMLDWSWHIERKHMDEEITMWVSKKENILASFCTVLHDSNVFIKTLMMKIIPKSNCHFMIETHNHSQKISYLSAY